MKIEILGPDEGWVDDTASRLTAALTPDLLLIEGKETVPATFDGAAALIEFLIGTAAGLSTEALRAIIVSAWRKARSEPTSSAGSKPGVKDGADAPEVTVTTTADGVVEVRVRPKD
ncbi:hypothetical protein ASG96_03900 [Terrabacter sp. Soil810]|nr:hypothetical protein ASG96_03900 [Terrabacter sp. Soil810]